jgi:hypothetical protein
MPYTAPSSKATGDLISAADWNQNTVTNPAYLKARLDYGYLWITSWKVTTTSPAGSGGQYESTSDKVNFALVDFDAAAIEYAFANVILPPDYDAGTITYLAVYTHAASASTDNKCVWGLSATSFAEGETLDLAYSAAVQSIGTPADNTAYLLHKSAESAAVTIAGTPAANELCNIRLSRVATDGNDTLSVDARLIGVLIKYGRA